jgi:nickel-type superoxide dismutase maturation protease
MVRHRRAAAGVALIAGAIAAALVTSVRRVEVVGGSMAPSLLPGDRLLVVGWPITVGRFRRPSPWPVPGQVVAVRDPRLPARVLVKRVASVDRLSGVVEVLGDAPDASTDSRSFGPVLRSAIVGRAVYRYAPVDRTGRGPWAGEYDRRP